MSKESIAESNQSHRSIRARALNEPSWGKVPDAFIECIIPKPHEIPGLILEGIYEKVKEVTGKAVKTVKRSVL